MPLSGAEAAAFTVLEMLDSGAPSHRFPALLEERRLAGAPPEELAALERATRLGLSIRAQTEAQQQREAHLSALFDAGFDLAVPQDMGTLLKVILRRGRVLLSTDMAWIGLLDEEGCPVIRASDGHTTDRNIGLRLPQGTGLGSATTRSENPSPFWTPDYLPDERIHHSPDVDGVVKAERLRAILAVPLYRGARPVGTLYLGDRTVRHFTTEEVALTCTFADLVSVALEQVRVLEHNAALIEELRGRTEGYEAGMRGARDISEIHQRLVQLVLDEGDLDALAREAGRELAAAVRILGASGAVLASAGEMPEKPGRDTVVPAGPATRAGQRLTALDDGCWAVPLAGGGTQLGTLVLRRPERSWSEQDRRVLRLVTEMMSLQLLLENSRGAAAEGRIRESLLGEMLLGIRRPPRELRQEARRLGIDLGGEHILVVARPEGDARGRLAAWASSYAHRMGGLNSAHQGSAVLLLPGGDAGRAARAVLDELAPLLGHPVTVGAAGPVSDPSAVRHALQEALRCLDAMTALGATGRAASLRELGFVGVLLADNHDVDGFIDATIGPVLDYDRQRFTDLLHTLEIYFEAGGSPTNAAKRLHVHANTVARRLERIGELLGPAWQEPERALEVQLALRVLRVRDGLGSPRPESPPPGSAPAGPPRLHQDGPGAPQQAGTSSAGHSS
ncbi:helix-turn-helix domain-containing protein [Streptomyces orinoci]|uniref:Helix-turn-helix domain-containing protein n=1 Tax=Streptomyces orinoci TaxID=67339 RepID=A0ABV3K438_STRON|nr:helix-turn-helix domain-containing protein [Streptomyces orinoci]